GRDVVRGGAGRRRPGGVGGRARGRRIGRNRLHGTRPARAEARRAGRCRHRCRAIRRRAALAVDTRVLLVAAEDLRVHGVRPSCRGSGDPAAPVACRQRRRGGLLAAPPAPGGCRCAGRAGRWGPTLVDGGGGARPGRARLQLASALPCAGCGVAAPVVVKILLPTDSFPPNCGGSGWSTYELARGLRARGHEVLVVQPRPGQMRATGREYDGFEVEEVAAPAPPIPYVRNYFKNERVWQQLQDLPSH